MSLAHRLLKRIRFQNPACQGINVSASAIPRSFRTFHIVAANESDPAAKRNVALKTKPGWRRSRQEKISGRREAQDALIANQKARIHKMLLLVKTQRVNTMEEVVSTMAEFHQEAQGAFELEAAVQLYMEAIRAGSFSPELCGIVMRTMVAHPRLVERPVLDQAMGIVQTLWDAQLSPSREVYLEILRACVEAGTPVHAMRILEEMAKEQLGMKGVPFFQLIVMSSRKQNVDAAWTMLDMVEHYGMLLPSPTHVHAFNSLISACAKTGRVDLALKVYQQLWDKGLGPQLPVATFNALLDACARRPKHSKQGVYPNHPGLAQKIWIEMACCRVTPDVVTYNSMINVCAEHFQPDLAREYLDKMQQQGLVPDHRTYTSLIKAFTKANRLSEAELILSEMLNRGMTPSAKAFTSLIKACGYADGGLERAWEIYDEMTRCHHVKPNIYTHSVLLLVCCTQHKHPMALSRAIDAMVLIMQAQKGEALRSPAPQHVHMLAKMLYYRHGSLVAGAFLQRALWNGIVPDRKLMGIMLKVFSESLAHELCSEHTELLHCAMETFQMARQQRLLSHTMYANMMYMLAQQEKSKQVWALLEDMRHTGLAPNEVIYCELFRGYGDAASDTAPVVALLQDMHHRGVVPSHPSTAKALGKALLATQDGAKTPLNEALQFKWIPQGFKSMLEKETRPQLSQSSSSHSAQRQRVPSSRDDPAESQNITLSFDVEMLFSLLPLKGPFKRSGERGL